MFELPSFVSSQPRGEQLGGVVRSRDLHTPVSQAEPALLNDFYRPRSRGTIFRHAISNCQIGSIYLSSEFRLLRLSRNF